MLLRVLYRIFTFLSFQCANITLVNTSMVSLLKWLMSFEHCWSPLGGEFEDLQRFCGGIASIMPGTTSIKSDFSLINWAKDSSSQSLTNFSLESILHCKQYKKLRDLFEWNYRRFIGLYLWSENSPNLNIEIDPKIAIFLISGFFQKQGGLLATCQR